MGECFGIWALLKSSDSLFDDLLFDPEKTIFLIILETIKNRIWEKSLLDLNKKCCHTQGNPGPTKRVRHWCSMLPPRGVSVGEILTGVLAGSEVSCGWTFNMWRAVLRTKERRRGPCSCFSCSISACFFQTTLLNSTFISLSTLCSSGAPIVTRERGYSTQRISGMEQHGEQQSDTREDSGVWRNLERSPVLAVGTH